ncbi:MAG: pilus assembly protein [Natronohydrobacter sp.]|nr:pilus assembly protein [Natronohydrobacter sp.]
MIRLPRFLQTLSRRWRAEDGAVTVEFVVVFPFVLSILLMAIDAGVTQLRQTFLNRSVDIVMRDVRLGRQNQSDSIKELICNRTSMLRNCIENITVEMRPVDTINFTGLDEPIRCINRELELIPQVDFDTGVPGEQELMLVKVCVVADPFIRITGFISQLPINADGDYVLVSTNIFVKEP